MIAGDFGIRPGRGVVGLARRRLQVRGLDSLEVLLGHALGRRVATQPVLVLRAEAPSEARRDEVEAWLRAEVAAATESLDAQ